MGNIEQTEKTENLTPEQANFKLMCDTTHKMVKPWQIALIATNVLWAIVISLFIWFAYMTPVEYEQTQLQDQPNQSQNQLNKGVNGQ